MKDNVKVTVKANLPKTGKKKETIGGSCALAAVKQAGKTEATIVGEVASADLLDLLVACNKLATSALLDIGVSPATAAYAIKTAAEIATREA